MTTLGDEPYQAPEVGPLGRSGRNAVVQLFLRTSALRVLSLLGTALLARLLLPEDFGIFAVVIFLVGLAAPLGDLGMGARLIQQPEQPTETEIGSVFILQQATWLVLFGSVWLLAPLISDLVPGMPVDFEWMLRVTALALVIGAQKALPAAMMARVLRFGPLAAVEVLQQSVYFGTALVLAAMGAGPWSFIAGLLLQAIVGTLLTYFAWGRRPPLGFDWPTARRALSFGVPLQAANSLAALRDAMVPAFGGLAGGLTAIGYLQFGQRMGRLVSGIDDVIGRVAFPAFSRLHAQPARANRAMTYAVESAGLLLALLLGWTVAVAPTLIVVVFSERWSPAVPVFQLAAVSALAGVPATFLRSFAFAAGENRVVLAWTIVAVVLSVVSFPIFLLTLGLPGGGISFVIYGLTQLLGIGYSTRHLVQFPWVRLGRIYVLGGLAGVVAALSLLAVGGLLGLLVSGVLFVATYGGLLIAFERDQLRRGWSMLVGGTALDTK